MKSLKLIIFLTTVSFAWSQKGVPVSTENAFVYLEKHNYLYENHTIITEDGYILLAVRLLHSKKQATNMKRPPVVLAHGYTGTFYDFLKAGPERGLGFEILREGYDVWLMNQRGSTYSRKHITIDPVSNPKAFWNFTFHEYGIYDMSATMDYITTITGFSNMSVVGFASGGTAYFALTTTKPEYDKRIVISVLLAPVTYLTHTTFPLLILMKKYSFLVDPLAHLFSLNEAGGSRKEVKHLVQVGKADKFQWYDYGSNGNKILYNKESPPLYNLSAVTSSVGIFYGENDFFVTPMDGARMVAEVPKAIPFIIGRNTSHLDVMWGKHAVEDVHKPAIKLLNKFNKMGK